MKFTEPPIAKAYADALKANGGPKNPNARAIAASAGRAQAAKTRAQHGRALGRVKNATRGETLYEVQAAMNGVAVYANAAEIAQLRRLDDVASVFPIEPEFPTASNSVPFLQVPKVWNAVAELGLPANYDGTGIRIGIIDTGIDYQHSAFGGTGLLADYQANNRTVAPDTYFPTAKVAGGFDFAGDTYTGSNAAVPDPDPMDCNGHGSHVAGTAAAFGVNADGTTYTGPYTTAGAYGPLRIQPGMAPQATLYGLRVFGCTGSTNLTVAAIEWAVDPNGDNDLSDHLDVINMSLGSSYGRPASASAEAADAAAALGVIVVASAGNSGDIYFVSGSPGSGSRVVAVAATTDDTFSAQVLQVNSGSAAGTYVASASNSFAPTPAPNPSGQTANIVLGLDPSDGAGPSTTDGCSALTNAAAVAGNIVLLDRGTCGFQVKAVNAQAAGAIGVIIANNTPGVPLISMGATGTTQVNIPTMMIRFEDRNTIVPTLPQSATMSQVSGADTAASFTSRGPRLDTPMRLKPDVAAPGSLVTSVQTGVTCTAGACQVPNASGYIPSNQPLVLSGTSMAAPHVAGLAALLRQQHPDWSVEQVKAALMNGAVNDVYLYSSTEGKRHGVDRVGAGRVDPPLTAMNSVLAYNADDEGLVSVTFEPEVLGAVTRTKTIRLVNLGTTDQTYDLSLDNTVTSPGVSFSLPGGSSVTVPAGGTTTFNVQMNANGSLMDHVRDESASLTQSVTTPPSLANLNFPRHFLTTSSAYAVLSQSGNKKLRVPLFAAAKPVSNMLAAPSIATGGAATGSTTIALSGQDVCTGTLGAGPSCSGVFPTDVVSLVSPFELQVVSPPNPAIAPPYADIQYAGVATDGTRIWFGVSTWGDWASPYDVSFTIYVDNDLNGTYDRQVITTSTGGLARLFGSTVAGTDVFVSGVFTPPGSISSVIAAATPSYVNRLSASAADTGLFGNNVMFFGATPAQLGLASANTPFRYKIETCPGSAPACQTLNGFHYDEAVGPFNWNGGAQGLNFGGSNLLFDLNGATIPVTWNTANMTANGSLGALLLHHHNKSGSRAQVVPLDTASAADLSISCSPSNPAPALGTSVTISCTATNTNLTTAATNTVVFFDAPNGGLSITSNSPSQGTFNASTLVWDIGTLNPGVTTMLGIVADVVQPGAIIVNGSVGAASPLDPNATNNYTTITLNAVTSADMQLSASAGAATVLAGAPITFTTVASNAGTGTAYDISVTPALNGFPGASPTAATPAAGLFSAGSWKLASLANGSNSSLATTYTAPNMAGTLTFNATGSLSTADPNSANNSATATVTVLSPANVSGTKTVTGQFYPGGTVTYTVTLSNTAAYTQFDNPGDEFTDILPTSLALVSASASSGTTVANVGTNTVTWNGAISPNGSVTITITATVTGTPGALVSNQGSIIFDASGEGVNETAAVTDDPGVGGAADAAEFTIVSPATISTATKSVAGDFSANGHITYTIVLTNSGPADQLDNPTPEFVDVVPASLTVTSATATSGIATVAGNTVTWNGSIAAGASVTIQIHATISPTAAGTTISNQGTASFDADGNGTNESTILTSDPAGPQGSVTSFAVLAVIPTASEYGLALLAIVLAGAALIAMRRA